MLFTYLDSSKILFEFLHSTLKMFEPVLLRCVGGSEGGKRNGGRKYDSNLSTTEKTAIKLK